MLLRSQMSDLVIKVLQKKTEGYMSSDLKRKSVQTLNPEINSEGDQSLRQKKSKFRSSYLRFCCWFLLSSTSKKDRVALSNSDECSV